VSRLMDRMVRASKLDIHVYEEIEADRGAMGQAMGVVVLSSIAAGIGSIGKGGLLGILLGAVFALIVAHPALRDFVDGLQEETSLLSPAIHAIPPLAGLLP